MPEEKQLPDWAQKTPGETVYCITMYNSSDSGEAQLVDITRQEFIELKIRLAELRGIMPAGDAGKQLREVHVLREYVQGRAVTEYA